MKTVSTDLFDLIKSLNSHEKAYFKRYSQAANQQKGQAYLELFELMNKQKDYDEPWILKKSKNYNSKNSLARAKKYLYQKILESMRAYNALKNKEQELKRLLLDIDFLIQKSLYQQAQKLINKVAHEARKNELGEILISLWRVQTLIWARIKFQGVDSETLLTYADEYRAIMNAEIDVIDCRIYTLNIAMSRIRQGKNAMWQSKEMLDDNYNKLQGLAELSNEAAFYKNLGQGIYWRIKTDYSTSLHYLKKAVSLLDEHSFLQLRCLDAYLDTMVHWLCGALYLFYENEPIYVFEQFDDLLQKYKKSMPEEMLISYQANYYALWMKYICDYMIYDRAEAYDECMMATWNALEPKWEQVDKVQRIIIITIFIDLLMLQGKYQETLDWFNKLHVLFDESAAREDIIYERKTMLVLIYIEIGEFDLASSILRSIIRKKTTELSELEWMIIKTLQAVLKNNHDIKPWKELIKRLEALAEKANSYPPLVIYAYASAKVKRKDFLSEKKEKVKELLVFIKQCNSFLKYSKSER